MLASVAGEVVGGLHGWVLLVLCEESATLGASGLDELGLQIGREVDVEVRSEASEHVGEIRQLCDVLQPVASDIDALCLLLHWDGLAVHIEAEGGGGARIGGLLVHHGMLLLLSKLFKIWVVTPVAVTVA